MDEHDEQLPEADEAPEDELDEVDGEVLPEREAMSVIDLGQGGGMGVPPAA